MNNIESKSMQTLHLHCAITIFAWYWPLQMLLIKTNGISRISTLHLTKCAMRIFTLAVIGTLFFTTLSFAQTTGDYRTISGGAWTNPGIWQRFNGAIWEAAPAAPSSTDGLIHIQDTHDVTIPGGQTVVADQVIINGNLTVAAGATFSLANGPGADLSIVGFDTDLIVDGTFIRQNLSEINNLFLATIQFNSGSVYEHRYTTTLGDLPNISWHPNSTVLFNGLANTTPISANATWNQSFGNVTFNSPGQRALVNFAGNLTTINGSLSVLSTGNNAVQLSDSQTLNLTIGQDLVIAGTGRLIFGVSGAVNALIQGGINYTSTSTAGTYGTFTGATTIDLAGDFIMDSGAGRFHFAGAGTSGTTTLNLLSGDFRLVSGRIDELGSNPSQGTIRFLADGEQEFLNSGTISGYFNYYVSPQTTLDLGNSPLIGASPSTFTLDGGTVIVGSNDALGAIHSGSNAGNIRTPNAYRTYAPGSTIIYRSSEPQFLGAGHPLASDVTTIIDSPAGVSLYGNRVLNHPIVLAAGILRIGANTLTINSTISSTGGQLGGTAESRLYLLGSQDGALGDIPFAAGENEVGILTLNRMGEDVTATITEPLTIVSQLNLTRGTLINNSTLTLGDGLVLTIYETSTLAGNSPTTPPGEAYHVTYRTFTPSGGPFATISPGAELPSGDALGNLTIQLAQTSDTFVLNRNVTVNGSLTLARGLMHTGAFNVVMKGPNWNDNGGNHEPGTGTIIFDGETVVGGSSSPLFGNIQVNAGANVTFARNFTVQGSVNFMAGSTVTIDAPTVTFNGSEPQTVSANGATFRDVTIAKGGGQGIMLLSTFNLTGVLRFASPSANVNLQSNGHLNLISTSDAGGEGTASIYRLASGNRISGDVVVNRFMSPEGRLWRYISSPVSNSSVAQLKDDFFVGGNFLDPSPKAVICGKTAPSNSTTIYYYDEAAPGGLEEGYVAYPRPGTTSAASPLQVGLGYSVFIRNCETPTIIDFSGPINQGTLTLPVTYTANDPDGYGWNLVGNPYPSTIDWDAGWTKTRISPQIAIRDYAADVFRYYEAGVTDELNGGQIAMGQAFWVRATGPNPVLRITETAKVPTVGEFFREAPPRIPNFMLALSDGTREELAYVKTVADAQLSLDEFDAPKIMNQTISLSTVASDNVPMAINAVESLTCGMVIPVRTDGLQPGRYSFRIDTREYFSEFAFILRDRYSDREVTLSSGTYEFVVDENPASANINRFEIRVEERMAFSDVVVATENICSDNVTIAINNADRDVKYAVWNTGGFAVSDVLTATSSRLSIALPAESVQSGEFVIKAISVCGSEGVVSAPFSLDRVLPAVALASTRNCATGSIELAASSNDANAVIRWFEREGDVTPVHTGAVFDVGKLNKTKTYFAEAVSSSGCVSPREQVVAEAAPLVEPELTVAGMKLVVNYATDNRWFFNDELIAENVTSVDLTESGEYRVELAVGGCVSVLNHFQEGVSGLQFYPNPVADKLIFKGITDDVQEISLVNTLGVNILPIYRKGQNFGGEVDVQSLSDGVYLLIVVQSNGKHIHRLVKGSK